MSARLFLLTFILTVVAVVCGLTALPHSRYLRFQQLAGESVHYMRAKWIYERIHFDRTPIDIAFIGTSHTQSGINSKLVEETLRENGIDQHVVNFAIPHLGRDLHYLLVRELIENRDVKKLVVEVQEAEPRAPHPAFQRLADVTDLLSSPLVINTGYFENLVRLPVRQSLLFLHTTIPGSTGDKPEFDRQTYEGSHWDDTYLVHGTDVPRLVISTTESLREPAATMEQEFVNKQSLSLKLTLPNHYYGILQRYNYFYLESLLDLARSKGTDVVFLYLPFFHGPEEPTAAGFLLQYGSMLKPTEILDDPSFWQNASHLNYAGANRLSVWVGHALAKR